MFLMNRRRRLLKGDYMPEMNQPTRPETGQGAVMGPGRDPGADIQEPTANPIITALQDIGKFIAAQQEQGSPNAAAMMTHFQQLLQAIQGQGEGAPQQGRPAPGGPAPGRPTPQGPSGPQQMAPQGVRGGMARASSGQMNENARPGSVPVL